MYLRDLYNAIVCSFWSSHPGMKSTRAPSRRKLGILLDVAGGRPPLDDSCCPSGPKRSKDRTAVTSEGSLAAQGVAVVLRVRCCRGSSRKTQSWGEPRGVLPRLWLCFEFVVFALLCHVTPWPVCWYVLGTSRLRCPSNGVARLGWDHLSRGPLVDCEPATSTWTRFST